MATGKLFQEVNLPEQKSYEDGIVFPAVLSPTTNTQSFTEAIKSQKPWLESLLNERGAILFRGFPVTSPSEFNDFVEAFGFPEAPYVGGRSPRTKVVGRVYTANESPPEIAIPFHHEMAYAPNFPSTLFLFCEEAPGSGGQTPIVLSHIVYEKMKEKHPEFVAQLEEHGMTYKKMMNDEDDQKSSFRGRGWKAAYNTDDKNLLKEMVAEFGMKLEWIGNTVKLITGPLPAIRIFDQESRRKVWFNNLATSKIGLMTNDIHDQEGFVELGNGDLVPEQAKKDCLEILEEECVVVPWKKGDIMLVNNLMVLHARQPVLKPPRRVLASLCK